MDYNERLQILKNQIVRKRKLHALIEQLKKDIKEKIKQEDNLKKEMIKEQTDVDKLENGSILSSLRFVFGNKDEILAKEEKEARVAYLKHKECLEKLAEYNNKYAEYVKEFNGYSNIEEEYINLLKQKKEYLKYNSEVSEKIIAMEDEIYSLKGENKEIDEAIIAGMHVCKSINKVNSSLNDAQNWSTFDLFGGGAFISMAKHSSLDNVSRYIDLLHKDLEDFKYELNDVTNVNNIDIKISGTLSMADIFFDNIFVDLMVQDKIDEAKTQIQKASVEVSDALSHLRNLKDNNETRIQVITQDLQDLVINTPK